MRGVEHSLQGLVAFFAHDHYQAGNGPLLPLADRVRLGVEQSAKALLSACRPPS